MEIATITSAIILAYIQSSSTTHVNLNSTNSMILNHSVRVPKCCREDNVMTVDGCMKETVHKFLPSVKVLIHNSTHVNDDPVVDVNFDSFTQNIDCPIGSYPLRPEEDIFYLLENGSLILTNQHKLLMPTEFCFESVDIGDDYEKWYTTAFVCVPLSPNKNNFVLFIIYIVGLSASSVALLVVVFANICNNSITTCCHFLRSKLLQRKHLTLYCAFLLCSYVMVAAAQIVHPTDTTCDVLGTLYYVFLIAAIGSLSLMAADTYSHVRKYGGNTERCSGSIQPTIILIAATFMLMVILLAYLDVMSAPRMFLKPQFGQNSCWYTGKKSAAFFFIVPVIFQITPNIILISLSQVSIKNWNIRSLNKQMDCELLKDIHFACFVLLVLTLVIWFGEMTTLLWEGVTKLSVPLDILECTQGVLVFLIFRKIGFQCLKYNASDYDGSRNTSDTSIIEPMV